MGYSKIRNLLDSSLNSALTTSNPYLVQDAYSIQVSLLTQTTASAYTLQASNADGFTAAIPANSWSNATVLTAAGQYAVTPGMRWLRAIQASNSTATVALTYM